MKRIQIEIVELDDGRCVVFIERLGIGFSMIQGTKEEMAKAVSREINPPKD